MPDTGLDCLPTIAINEVQDHQETPVTSSFRSIEKVSEKLLITVLNGNQDFFQFSITVSQNFTKLS